MLDVLSDVVDVVDTICELGLIAADETPQGVSQDPNDGTAMHSLCRISTKLL